jgi:tetratricopeptide (TPR) repeat protein/tRNA A-37 threonylcarbamoyl transferase component Bud32
VTSNDWKRVKELFTSVVALAEDDRDSYLAAQSDSNEVLNEVSSLLSNYLESPDFLEGVTPPLPLWDLADEAPATLAGRRIGAWQLVREIGRGGMGVVWEARRADQQYDQRAAVKLLRASLLSEREIRRFREERQILASLNHPCIARLLDGGMMDDGSPYLVMEYVDGLPLDAWCDREQLNVRKRLEVFLLVCSAVEYAHRQLVIHRDLKPANILVTASDGTPKLLDFGIAKLIQEGVEEKHSTTRLLTPECASPEQVRGERMTTANDIFSLGVLLYSLLTGHHPFAVPDATPLEAMRAICEMEPRLPSSVAHDRRKELHGELDAVILQALRKNPVERYPSVRALADDVRAWLEGLPVSAVRQSWGSRFVKLIWRYKVQSAAIALAAASLLAGMVVTSIEAKHARLAEHEALVQRDRALSAQQSAFAAEQAEAADRNRALTESHRADEEATSARTINEFLENDLLSQASPITQTSPDRKPDPDLKVRTALDRAAERIKDRFAGQPLIEASIRHSIGGSYFDLALFSEAQLQIEREVELRRKAHGETAPDTLAAMEMIAAIYRDQMKFDQSEQIFKQVLRTQQKTLGDNSHETLNTLADLATLYYFQGRNQEAESILLKVITKRRALYPKEFHELIRTTYNLSLAYHQDHKTAAAEAIALDNLKLARQHFGEDHPDTYDCRKVMARILLDKQSYPEAEKLMTEELNSALRIYGAESLTVLEEKDDLAVLYLAEGRAPEAADLLAQVVEMSRRINGKENHLTLIYECTLAITLERLGRFAEAEKIASPNLETLRRVYGENDSWTIVSERTLATLYRAQGRYKDAERIFTELLDHLRRSQSPGEVDLAVTTTNLGVVYLDEGRDGLAETTLTEALALDHKAHPDERVTRTCLTALGRLRLAQHRYAEAESLLREAMSGKGNQNLQLWDTFDRQSLLGASLMGQGKYAEAEPLLIAGYEGLKKLSPAISVDANLPQAGDRLVQLYAAWRKPAQAEDWRRQLGSAPK